MSEDQSKMMRQYHLTGFKTLVSNDYDLIIESISQVRYGKGPVLKIEQNL